MEGSVAMVPFYSIKKLFSFTNCILADNKHKMSWFEKGFCEDELNNYSEALKRLINYYY